MWSCIVSIIDYVHCSIVLNVILYKNCMPCKAPARPRLCPLTSPHLAGARPPTSSSSWPSQVFRTPRLYYLTVKLVFLLFFNAERKVCDGKGIKEIITRRKTSPKYAISDGCSTVAPWCYKWYGLGYLWVGWIELKRVARYILLVQVAMAKKHAWAIVMSRTVRAREGGGDCKNWHANWTPSSHQSIANWLDPK